MIAPKKTSSTFSDFEAFYAHRKQALAKLIEDTMQKPISADAVENEPMGPVEDDDELIALEIV